MYGDLVKKLIESIESPCFIKNSRGVYTECNATFEKMLGISKNYILGRTAFDIAPQSLAKIYSDADKELFQSSIVQVYKGAIATRAENVQVVFSKTIFLICNSQLVRRCKPGCGRQRHRQHGQPAASICFPSARLMGKRLSGGCTNGSSRRQ